MRKISLILLLATLCTFSVQMSAQSADTYVKRALEQVIENEKMLAADANFVITDDTKSTATNGQHIYYRQLVHGIEVVGTESAVHLNSDGLVLAQNNRFVSNANNRAGTGNSPSLNAVQAVQAAANQLGYSITESLKVLSSQNVLSKESVLSKGGISKTEIPAKLVYHLTENNELLLSWDLSIHELSGKNWWSVRVDANSGQILDQDNWIISCNLEHNHAHHEAGEETLDFHKNLYDIPNYDEISAGGDTYEVIALPAESPYFATRTIEIDPANATASQFGWHDTNGVAGPEFTITRGNNVYAYEDGDNQGFSPDGGAQLDFTGYPFSQTYTNSNQYESAAITNLFYWNNIIHDVLFLYGFDEEGGNFQELNYSGLGAGSDSVNAEAQDGSGTCNANFGTPPDGGNPQMQMYVCGDKDGDFDNLVIIHEYGHGVSNRLTGGPSQAGCLGGQEQMGEGWSDYLGVVMTIEPGDMGADRRGVGTYLTGTGPTGNGIRSFPYSTDMSINPHTYDDIKTEVAPHGVGSVWAMMLWELTWALVDEHGIDNDIYNFTGDVNVDAGNVQALALVMEGMKLQPCSPGFVDGRDAIFAADIALYGGANECVIWDAFAKRGLGLSADQGSSGSKTDGTEAFDTPSGMATITAPNDVCEGSVVLTNLSGGTPFGGVYSGPGVTDDGNGATYSFDPNAAGVGVHSITYTVPNGTCTVASNDSDTIEVIGVAAGPATVGDTDVCQGDEATVSATPNDPANVIYWYDAAAGGDFLFEGENYTFNPIANTTVYAQERPAGPASKLVVSELNFEAPDRLELQNVGDAFDYTGYTVAVSEQPYTDINTMNATPQTLGNMGADSVIDWSDETTASNYWGSNIWWGGGSNGWVIIIDDSGNVVESVFWNLTEAEIANLDVTINGFNITAADIEFLGDGADLNNACNTASSFRRISDTDMGTDFTDTCVTADFGTPNSDIGDVSGFLGCLSLRSPAEVTITLDTVDPTIANCPTDQTEIVAAGAQFTIPDYTVGVTATDNCTDMPVISQNPAVGTQVGVGVIPIVITAVDIAGNDVDCTFNLTVEEEILGVNETVLEDGISMFPNPTSSDITLVNNSTKQLVSIVFTDVNGRIISTTDLSKAGMETSLSLEGFATGLYFAKINSENGTIVKRIIKK